MVLDNVTVQNSIWNTNDDFTQYLDTNPSNILSEKNSHFSAFLAFIEIFLRFSCLHANHKQRKAQYRKLAILGGSIDTYPQLAGIDSIDTWYRYRGHPYPVMRECIAV